MDIQIARELTAHRVNGLNEALRIFVLDKPGSGGACHDYAVLIPIKNNGIPQDTKVQRSYSCLDGSFNPFVLAIYENDIAVIVSHEQQMDAEKLGLPLPNTNAYAVQRITFQNGPVKEAGYNGSSHEALLAILLDRMEGFQSGQFANAANAMALNKLEEARLWLNKRTMDRVARGVEGTHQK